MAALNFPSNPSDGDTYSANDTVWIYSSSLSKWIRSRQTLATTYIPIGTVIWFSANTPPSGYLECDGSAISRTVYADLFSTIGTTFGSGDGSTTFNLPDLRGEFVRGWDNGRGADSGRGFGSTQSWAIENITGSVEPSGTPNEAVFGEEALTATGAFELEPSISGDAPRGTSQSQPGGFNFDASRVVQTADETRPRNVALLPCIRAFGQVDIEGAADLSALLTTVATQAEMEAGNDTTKLVTPENVKYSSGVAKAWITYDQTTPTLLDNLNISSATDEGTGELTFDFSNNMTDVNYSSTISVGRVAAGATSGAAFSGDNKALATSGWGVLTRNVINSPFDYERAMIQIWGDLA